MILYIEPFERDKYSKALEGYYRLRKKVFCDTLQWVEDNGTELERDEFDEGYGVYILYQDDAGRIGGGVRLMPTTGPTLLHTVWADLLPEKDDFRSPNIWEATRFCVDEDIVDTRNLSLANKATLALSLAVVDFADSNGISHVIAVCESYFFEMGNAYDAQAEILSTKTDENGVRISCGLWSTKEATTALEWARPFLGGQPPMIGNKVA